MRCVSTTWSRDSCFNAARCVIKNSSFTWKRKTARSFNSVTRTSSRETKRTTFPGNLCSKRSHAQVLQTDSFLLLSFIFGSTLQEVTLPGVSTIPRSDGRCRSRRPVPIVFTAEETNVYLKWINSCSAALFIRFIFWPLIPAYNIACHFLQLTEARLNCPE